MSAEKASSGGLDEALTKGLAKGCLCDVSLVQWVIFLKETLQLLTAAEALNAEEVLTRLTTLQSLVTQSTLKPRQTYCRFVRLTINFG